MNRAARNDLIFGSTVLGLALRMLFVGIPIGIESPGDVDILALAPTFWPNIIMALGDDTGKYKNERQSP